MPFAQSAGRFVVTDTDNRVAFDTDYRTLHQTNYFTGSFTVPERNCIENEIDTTTHYVLGSAPTVCNAILGQCYIQRASNFASGAFEVCPLNIWLGIGGTIDLTLGRGQGLSVSGTVITGGADSDTMVGIQQLTFEVDNGTVRAAERVKYLSTRASSLLQTTFGGSPSYRVDYHVFALAVDL